MRHILSVAAMRAADRYTIDHLGVPSLWLMARAGHAVAQSVIAYLAQGRRVAIIVGRGNNGGDGLVAAAVLLAEGYLVDVLLTRQPECLRGDAAACYQALSAQQDNPQLQCHVIEPQQAKAILSDCALLVDAMFGSGLSRPVQGVDADWIKAINASERPVLSVDIASGLDGDNGVPLGCAVQACWTLPIAASLRGQWRTEASTYCGEMLPAADIGIPPSAMQGCDEVECMLMDSSWLNTCLPKPLPADHKGSFGHLWVFAGSQGLTGAAKLAVRGAIAAHAGCVSLVCPDEVYPVLAQSMDECMVHPQSSMSDLAWQQASALLIGPGWGKQQQALLALLLTTSLPLLLDADALNLVAASSSLQQCLRQRQAVSILTPHPGEAARLLGVTSADVQANRFDAAASLQRRFDCLVALKGQHTLIADQDWQCLCPFGSPRLARGGSGDVLAGVAGALLARGLPPREAIALAVGQHALAGEQNDWMGSSELPHAISRRFAD